MQLTQTIANRFAAVLVALGLMVMGFGHQHTPASADDRMLAAYVQMGGALDDLCVTGQDGPQSTLQDCPVCTLAQIMALGADGSQAGPALRITTIALPRAGHLLAKARAPRGPPVRGPPASFV